MSKLLILNGSKCSGKSSVAKVLWASRDRTILLSLDSICWLFSSYDTEKTYSLELAGRVGLKMVESYLSEDLDVIVEKAFNQFDYIAPFVKVGKKHDAETVVINIEAPLEVLLERTKKRINTSQKEEVKKTTSKSIKLSYDNYLRNRFEVNETYDSSKLSVEQIVEDIKNKYLFSQ